MSESPPPTPSSKQAPGPFIPELWHQCLGREEETDILLEAWQRVRSKSQPQWINLVASSGWGKTRLIHEFYERIGRIENEGAETGQEGYWPDRLTIDPNSMVIEPPISQSNNPEAVIPWLWVGLRWSSPDARNVVQTSSVLHDAFRQIQPHLVPMLLTRTRKKAARNAATSLFSLALKVVPFGDLIGEVTGGGKTVRSLVDNLKSLSDSRDKSNTSLAEIHEEATVDIRERTRELLALFLDRRQSDLPTVPVVLVLDDAQWIDRDPQALEFLKGLWHQACRAGWPLLVLASHYQKEWNEFEIGKSPHHLRSVFEPVDGEQEDVGARVQTLLLKRIRNDHCERIVRASFPGLRGEQVDYILNKAAANMRFLLEMLLHLGEQHLLFEGEDPSRALSEHGFERFRNETTGWQKFIARRIAALGAELRAALNILGGQGLRFLDDIAALVASRLADEGFDLPLPEGDAVIGCVELAEDPHALISLQVLDGISRRLGEFRHPEYLKALRNTRSAADLEWIARVTAETLWDEWQAGRLPVDQATTWDLLLAHISVDEQSSAADGMRRCQVLIGAFAFHQQRWDLETAREMSREAMALVEQHDLDALSLADQVTLDLLAGHLHDSLDFVNSRKIAETNCHRYRQLCDSPDTRCEATLQGMAASLGRIGNVLLSEGKRGAALELYQRGLELSEQIVNDFGPAHQRLRHVAVDLAKIGDVLRSEGKWRQASERYHNCLELFGQVVDEFGPTPESLRELSAGLGRVGDILRLEGEWQKALDHYQRALELSEQIVDDFGSTPESLGDLASSLDQVASLLLLEGKQQQARKLYDRSLGLFEQVIDDFGSTPQSLLKLSSCLGMLGGLELSEGNRQEALGHYQRSLQLCYQLADDFGPTSEGLRELAAALDRVGYVLLSEGSLEQALERFQRCLQLCEQVVDDFGPTPQSLRDLAVSVLKVGDTQLAEGKWRQALECHQRSLEIFQRIVDDFGAMPQSLEDLGAGLNRMGDALRSKGEREKAMEHYQRSLELSEQIVDDFGPTPDSLRGLTLSLERVGDVMVSEGERQQALVCFRRNLVLREQIVDDFGGTPQSARDLSLSLARLGDVMLSEGEVEQALDHYQRSVEIREKIVSDYGGSSESLLDLSSGLDQVGSVMLIKGEHEQALDRFQHSLEIREKIIDDFGPSPKSLRGLAHSSNLLGDLMQSKGDRGQALEFFQRSLEVAERIVDDYGRTLQAQRDLEVTQGRLALVARDNRDWSEFCRRLRVILPLLFDRIELYGITAQALEDFEAVLTTCAEVRSSLDPIPNSVEAATHAWLEQASKFLEASAGQLQAMTQAGSGAQEAAAAFKRSYEQLAATFENPES